MGDVRERVEKAAVHGVDKEESHAPTLSVGAENFHNPAPLGSDGIARRLGREVRRLDFRNELL